jgi:hypothetical protein
VSVYSSFRIAAWGGGGGGKRTIVPRSWCKSSALEKKSALSPRRVYSAKSAFDSFFSHPFFSSLGRRFALGSFRVKYLIAWGGGGGWEAERQLLINCSYIGP